MNVTVIGGGSLGLLYSYYFAKNHDVSLLVRTKDQCVKLRQAGLTAVRGEKEHTVHTCKVHEKLAFVDAPNMVVVAVKSYQVQGLLPLLNEISVETPLLFLQNGAKHIEDIESLPHRHIAVATVEHGAKRMDAHTVQINGINKTNVARFSGSVEKIVHELFAPTEDIFPYIWHSDMNEMVAKKVIVNAVINPLTTIIQCENGELIQNKYYAKLCQQVFDEVMLSFPTLNKDVEWENIKKIILATKKNTSSMLADRMLGRKTEIEGIIAPLISSNTPLLSSLYLIVKGLEERV